MEIASLSLGIATIGSAFGTCVELYRAIQTVKVLPDDLRKFSLLLAIEQQRFLTFQRVLNRPGDDQRLEGSTTTTTSGTSPIIQSDHNELESGTAETIRRNIFGQILKAMEHNLRATKGLVDKYSSPQAGEPTGGPAGPQRQENQSPRLKPLRRLSWVLQGERQLEEMTKGLRQLNDGLSALAPSHIAARLDLDLLARMLRSELPTVGEGQQAIPDNPSYSTLGQYATIRQGYEHLGGTTAQAGSPKPKLFGSVSHEILFRDIKNLNGRTGHGERTTAILSIDTGDDLHVLIEWRKRFRTSSDTMVRPRLNGLVSILQKMAEMEANGSKLSFGVLSCIGWTLPRAASMDSIGFVFQTPRNISTAPVSLYERMHTDVQAKPPTARSLGIRFRLAQKLVKIFALVLAVKCLHRGVRSHNILFFQDNSLEDPHLAGFIESRADQASQVSSLIDDEKGDYELYRPLTHGVKRQGNGSGAPDTMRLQHDLYGLGVILLEIGLWKTANAMRGRAGLRDFHQEIIPQYVEQLSYRVGDCYHDAVHKCLHSINQGADEAGLEYAAAVAETLARCSA